MADERQDVYDYSEFGNDAGLIEKLMKSPAKVKELLDSKRSANEQAKEQRLLIKSLAKAFDQTEQELAQVAEVYEGLKNGQTNYSQLDEGEQEIALLLVGAGSLDPRKAGVPEQDIEEYFNAISQDDDDEIDNYGYGDEVMELKRELSLRELADELEISPKNFKKFKKLWDDPEIDDTLSDADKEKAWQEHIDAFKAENDFLFTTQSNMAQSQTTLSTRKPTDNRQTVSPSQRQSAKELLTTQYEDFRKNGDTLGMLNTKTQIEKLET